MAKVQQNLRKSPLLVEYFSFWTNSTLFCPLVTGTDSGYDDCYDSGTCPHGYILFNYAIMHLVELNDAILLNGILTYNIIYILYYMLYAF